MNRVFDIDKVYTACSRLDKKQHRLLSARLRSEGINVVAIRCFAYADAPGIKHLFFLFDGETEETPYFMLDKDLLIKIQNVVLDLAGNF